jgi:hypothetical protein
MLRLISIVVLLALTPTNADAQKRNKTQQKPPCSVYCQQKYGIANGGDRNQYRVCLLISPYCSR